MPASKKPRKAYRPRPVLANAAARAMNAVTRLTPAEVEQGAGAAERAFDALETGDDPAAGNVAPGTQVLGVDMGAPGGDQTVYYLPDENGRPALCSPKEASHG